MKRILFILLTLFLASAFAAAQAPSPKDEGLVMEEQRGVWLATVVGLDWPRGERSHFVQRSELISDIRELASMGCNTLYFQVVSEMDAMYASDILPWSRQLTGVEGMSPYFDPLSIAVRVAHDNGMAIHAWINPLRVSLSDSTERARTQVKHEHPEWVHNYGGREYLDPGNPEVVQFLSDITREILTRYDVDGIHIDDYFYPDGLREDSRGWSEPGAWNDSTLFATYGNGLSLEEWRFSNIDSVVTTLHRTTHEVRPQALFGVSPQGRVSNTCRLYADPRRWVAQGSVDYILPQLYWSIGRGDFAAFPKVLKEWKSVMQGVPLYIGLAAYKHDPLFWQRRVDSGFRHVEEFGRQIEMVRECGYASGHVWFRAQDLLEREDLKEYILDNIY
ncbi:MAG: family 10 glycosylhydrolase [Bacteroidales bacterium]|nr:family 10 glycosylhydrolase [Bacteroidales bacterium]